MDGFPSVVVGCVVIGTAELVRRPQSLPLRAPPEPWVNMGQEHHHGYEIPWVVDNQDPTESRVESLPVAF